MPATAAVFKMTPRPDRHRPVMVEEAVNLLRLREGVFVDATVGYGGHAEALLAAGGPGMRLVGIDRDAEALEAARERLHAFAGRVTLVKGNFSRLSAILDRLGVGGIDGVLFDLGMSSPQVDEAERGFGFKHPGPLDMRMDRDQDTTAASLVNCLSAADLEEVLEAYGEERFAGRIARYIVHVRRSGPIETTAELAAAVASAIPSRFWPRSRHPATRTFQALRIAVNNELDVLPAALEAAALRLAPGGRIVVLAYHSLEDRRVKQTFRRLAAGALDPAGALFGAPGAGDGRRILDVLTKRPLRPGEDEVRGNPRSRSARLRAAERRSEG